MRISILAIVLAAVLPIPPITFAGDTIELAHGIAPQHPLAGYSNDVFAYIPSTRVLLEGGYEGVEAMRYTSLPGPFQPTVEEKIVTKVSEMVTSLRSKASQ